MPSYTLLLVEPTPFDVPILTDRLDDAMEALETIVVEAYASRR